MDTVLTVISGLTLITGGGRTLTVRLTTGGFGRGTIAFTAIALSLGAASSFFALLLSILGLVQLDGGNVLAGSPGFASESR